MRRFASGKYPLDEALIDVALDLSGRPHVEWHVDIPESLARGNPAFDPQLAEHAVSASVTATGITLHVDMVLCRHSPYVYLATFTGPPRALRYADLAPAHSRLPSDTAAL